VLRASRDVLLFYRQRMNDLVTAISKSGLMKCCSNDGDIEFYKQLRSATLNEKSKLPIDFKDNGVKPALVHEWNSCKNAQDVLQRELEYLRKRTSRESANAKMLWSTILMTLSGAIHVFQANCAVQSGKLETCKTRYELYSLLRSFGSIQECAFKLGETYDPKEFVDVTLKPMMNDPDPELVSHQKNPFFLPSSKKWQEDVTAKAVSLMRSGKMERSFLEYFCMDENLDAARLGKSNDYVHERRHIVGSRLTCVVCCGLCKPDCEDHARHGYKTSYQCSKCLAPLCDSKPRFERHDLKGLTCFDIWHSIEKDKLPKHPFTGIISPATQSKSDSTPRRVEANDSKRRKKTGEKRSRSNSNSGKCNTRKKTKSTKIQRKTKNKSH